eukprot:TRINITY_DN64088_c0_g1_i1.p1 TRINITY_DN64088_c0_g1~~TRINITY_DN64088_c0_g1_i1.p1  ORF type:complete len:754 (+),score=98.33 TRINITY_DN64088_c0_g1_i1:123-2264(+)
MVGQPVAGQVIQGTAVPFQGGADVVVGIPISQRAQNAINAGNLPEKANPDQIMSGAEVLDNNPYLPDSRPCRDLPFAVCFFLVFLALVGTLGAFGMEIPKLMARVGTHYESYVGKSCPGTTINQWPDGKSTSVNGINQRLVEATESTSSSRRLSEQYSAFVNQESSGPVLELAGLSSYVRRLELFGLAVPDITFGKVDESVPEADVVETNSSRRLRTSRRRRTETQPVQQVIDQDCQRACAAYEECDGFDVEVSGSTTYCYYKKIAAGSSQDPYTSSHSCSGGVSPCSACWLKVDAAILSTASKEILQYCVMFTVVGTVVSMVFALVFLKMASVQPAAATYCGVYFVPGCMIALGAALIGILFPLVGVMAGVVGGVLFLCGGCLCGCTYFCYRDLIPFTIEVVKAVTDIAMKYWSMLFVSLCGTFAGIVWSFLCVAASIAVYAMFDRQNATTPAMELGQSDGRIGYIQHFFMCVVYFWGAYTAFNLCHVAFAGVFGRWYFGRDGPGTIGSSLKVALTTSFGSICCGSLVIAVIRALEEMMRRLQRQAREEGNMVLCLIACIMKAIINCIGDILEWISQYCFVQCALRGLNFWEAAKATYALATISNLVYVVSQMLVTWVVGMGAILCALSGAVIAGLAGYYTCGIPGFCVYLGMMGGFFGCLSGLMTGGSALGVMNSGAVTILMCWAEKPDVLQKINPVIYQKFMRTTNMIED